MAQQAKPFLKWAGGKSQLLPQLLQRLPSSISGSKVIENYVEPFVGGGAMFFYLKSNLKVKNAYLLDINPDLINAYKIVQKYPDELIQKLKILSNAYFSCKKSKDKEFYFYRIRDKFNLQPKKANHQKNNSFLVQRATYLIFLNKTCYNGLFRQNKKGKFNVPFGDYQKPCICDENNIKNASTALKNAKIICDDFEKSEKYIESQTFVYIDPPYKPVNTTSMFTGYTKEGFTDFDQQRLSVFYSKVDKAGAYLLLSNSDPKNENKDFFRDKYSEYKIERVKASRAINCIPDKRGLIDEIIVNNYL